MMHVNPSYNICESFLRCMKNFWNYDGRARRSEFWWFAFICSMVTCFYIIIFTSFININDYYDNYGTHRRVEIQNETGFAICLCCCIFIEIVKIFPFLAASTRRLHDVGYSGLHNFLIIVPILNFFLLYLWVLDSDVGDNIYGPSPKYSYPQNSLSMNNIGNTLSPPIISQPISNQRQVFMNETTQQPFVPQQQYGMRRSFCSECDCFW